MINFIKEATAEFEKNGRSTKFVKMENRIIQLANPMQAYFFARYAKGADVSKLQTVMEKKGTLEQCYYYQQFVKGANLDNFIKKAVKENDSFWIEKFVELANDDSQYDEIKQHIKDSQTITTSTKLNKHNFDLEDIIQSARYEYKRNGRSQYFEELEKMAFNSKANAHGILFLQEVEGASVKNLERIAILKGDAFNIFLIATEIAKSNKALMMKAIEMTKLDHDQIEKSLIEQIKSKKLIRKAIENETDERKIKSLITRYNQISVTMPEYIVQIDNRYIPRMEYVIKHPHQK